VLSVFQSTYLRVTSDMIQHSLHHTVPADDSDDEMEPKAHNSRRQKRGSSSKSTPASKAIPIQGYITPKRNTTPKFEDSAASRDSGISMGMETPPPEPKPASYTAPRTNSSPVHPFVVDERVDNHKSSQLYEMSGGFYSSTYPEEAHRPSVVARKPLETQEPPSPSRRAPTIPPIPQLYQTSSSLQAQLHQQSFPSSSNNPSQSPVPHKTPTYDPFDGRNESSHGKKRNLLPFRKT
jgi:hypothetical protein